MDDNAHRRYAGTMTTKTPGQLRTAAATAARKRAKLNRMTETLREAGRLVALPEDVAAIHAEADRIQASADAIASGSPTSHELDEATRLHAIAHGLRTALELLQHPQQDDAAPA